MLFAVERWDYFHATKQHARSGQVDPLVFGNQGKYCNLGKGKVQDFLTEKYSFLLNGARVFMQEKQNAHYTQVDPLGFFSQAKEIK